jgi:hypothetical protein
MTPENHETVQTCQKSMHVDVIGLSYLQAIYSADSIDNSGLEIKAF